MMENSLYPYLYVIKLFENEENQVYQYYYDNGYCINRENTFDLHNFNKESILTRRLFNYVKLNENIGKFFKSSLFLIRKEIFNNSIST